MLFFYCIVKEDDKIDKERFLRAFKNFKYPIQLIDNFPTSTEKLKEFIEHGDN